MTFGPNENDYLLPYSPLTALDRLDEAGNGQPLYLWRLLYPVWIVEIPGTRIVRRDLAPFEATILHAVREGGAQTTADLAAMLGIDADLLDRVLLVQQRIGHLGRDSAGRLTMGRLGANSLRDGVSYRREEGANGTMIFDAFTQTPLPDMYGPEMLITTDQLDQPAAARFLIPLCARHWDNAALRPVITSRTLPEVTPRAAYLPLYLVETTGPKNSVACTATPDRIDTTLSTIIATAKKQDAFLAAALTYDIAVARATASAWLTQRGLLTASVTRTAGGEWRAELPPDLLKRGQGGMSLARLGTYELIQDPAGGVVCLRIWCADRTMRHAAAEAQVKAQQARRPQTGAAGAGAHSSSPLAETTFSTMLARRLISLEATNDSLPHPQGPVPPDSLVPPPNSPVPQPSPSAPAMPSRRRKPERN